MQNREERSEVQFSTAAVLRFLRENECFCITQTVADAHIS
jgi:hypothetical protein